MAQNVVLDLGTCQLLGESKFFQNLNRLFIDVHRRMVDRDLIKLCLSQSESVDSRIYRAVGTVTVAAVSNKEVLYSDLIDFLL